MALPRGSNKYDGDGFWVPKDKGVTLCKAWGLDPICDGGMGLRNDEVKAGAPPSIHCCHLT